MPVSDTHATPSTRGAILVLAPNYKPKVGGVAEMTHQLCLHLTRLGWQVIVLAQSQPGDEDFDPAQPFAIHRRDWRALKGRARHLQFWRQARELARRHDIRFALATTLVPEPWLHALRLLRIPSGILFHGNDISKISRRRWHERRHYAALVAGMKVFVNSRFTGELVRRTLGDRLRPIILGCGIDGEALAPPLPRDEARRRLGLPANGPLLLTVARLTPHKGIDVMIRALPRILAGAPDLHYCVAGGGEDLDRLQSLAREHGVADRVHFTGFFPDQLRPALYGAADLFVMPSRHNAAAAKVEGFGIVYAEAGHYGLAAVGGAAGGTADAITHGETGLLVEPESESAIADAVAALLADPARLDALGEANRRRVAGQLQWRHVAERLDRALAAPAPPPEGPDPATPRPPLRARRWFFPLLALVMLAALARLLHLEADFLAPEMIKGGLLFTDEGWYANNAITAMQTGRWHAQTDLNFIYNLPVLQLFHYLGFNIFGLGIVAARLTICAFFFALCGLIYGLLWRWEGHWTALLGVALLMTSDYAFAFSRLALAELPMAFFALSACALASLAEGPRRRPLTLLSTLAQALAFYTKSTAIFSLPLWLAILFWTGRRRPRPWLAPAVALGLFTIIVLAHLLALAIPHHVDYSYFHRTNVGMHMTFHPLEVLDNFEKVAHQARIINKPAYRLILFGLPLLALACGRLRRHPLFWFAALWFVLYVGMFATYPNFKNRYWMPLLVPYSIGGALLVRHLWHETSLRLATGGWPRRIALVLLIGAAGLLAATGAQQLHQIGRRLADPNYTFRDMAGQVAAIIAADGARPVLMAHGASLVTLYEPSLRPVNLRYGPDSFADRLAHHQPDYLLTLGPIDFDLHYDGQPFELPDPRYDKALAILGHHPEPIAQFQVLREDYDPLYLYRLR